MLLNLRFSKLRPASIKYIDGIRSPIFRLGKEVFEDGKLSG